MINADIIFLEPPADHQPNKDRPATLNEKGEWVEMIAHESVHAYRYLLGLRRAGRTAAERIQASIDDEIATRKTERQIVDELRNKFSKFKPYEPKTGRFDVWAVQRDMFPGELRRNYLEHFVLGERLFEARKALSESDVTKYVKFIGEIDLSKRPLTSYLKAAPPFVNPRKNALAVFKQDYPNLLLAQRVIDARWRSVKDLDRRDDFYRDAQLEKMRQEHATAFFGGLATYAKVP